MRNFHKLLITNNDIIIVPRKAGKQGIIRSKRKCCIMWDWGMSDKYDDDVIWPKYAISLANLAVLLC